MKPLPQILRCVFLNEDLNHPVIVNVELGKIESGIILATLKRYSKMIRYTIDDVKVIRYSICMHKFLLEEYYKS